jgi:hypothetical protein
MEPAAFYSERTPLTNSNEWPVCEPTLRAQLKTFAWVTGYLLGTAACSYAIYDGAKTLSHSPSERDLTYSIIQLTVGSLVSMFNCAIGGKKLAEYQNIKELYPNQEAYQGNIIDFYNFDNDSQQFDQAVWNPFLNKFLNEFEPFLIERYFISKKISPDQRIAYLCNKLKKGCCYGFSMSLLSKMKKNARLSSDELKSGLKIENAAYYQLVYRLLLHLAKDDDYYYYPYVFIYNHKMNGDSLPFAECLNLYEENSKKEDDITPEEISKEINDLKENIQSPHCFILNYFNLFADGILLFTSDELVFDQLEEESLLESLNLAEKAVLHQAVERKVSLAGHLSLEYRRQTKKYAHAFFFQISDGYYRFFDSASHLFHFFEFPNKEKMARGLKEHIQTVYINFFKAKDVSIRIILIGIPQ